MAMVNCPECEGNVSDQATVCPHCGYPLKKKEEAKEEYVLTKGSAVTSGFATFLRVLAWITWVGGLIISIAGAMVTEVLRYSTARSFSFSTFLTLFITYVVYGAILMCLATVIDQVSMTFSIVNGLQLEKKAIKKEEKKASNSSFSFNSHGGGDWICPVCKHSNKSWDATCTHCGEPKKR